LVHIEGVYLEGEVTIKDLPTHIEIKEAGLDDLKTIKVTQTTKGFKLRSKLDITPGTYEIEYEDETIFIDKIEL